MGTFKKVLFLLDRRQRQLILVLFAAMIVTGLIQMAGIGSVLPFVRVLTQPELVQENAALHQIYGYLQFQDPHAFLFSFGFAVLLLLVLGNSFVLFTQWLIARVTWRIQRDLSQRLLSRYLAQPYTAHLVRNSADYGKNILMETQNLASGVIQSSLILCSASVVSIAIVSMLVVVHPILAGLIMVLFGTAYVGIYWTLRRKLLEVGRRNVVANIGRFKAVAETFGSVKEVKVLQREREFMRRYAGSAHSYAETMALQYILNQVPRNTVEALAFGSVMLVILFLMRTESGLAGVLPLLSIYALAGYRLLPAFQQIYTGFSQLRFYQAAVDAVYKDYRKVSTPTVCASPAAKVTPLALHREIRLEKLTFTYPGAVSPAVIDVDLTIPKRSFVAFVGSTGAGKTTLADIVLGVLPTDSGSLLVDGVPVRDENRRAWQANLGYVPQEIYLTDDTVAANIAFGVRVRERDKTALERAARSANIHDFIMHELPKGYDTLVGERGVRLSGGQRQRIGIARALYGDPEVLVLDEATSALDGVTEAAVHRAILQAAQMKTVVVIAHRLGTVRDCEKIFLLDHGRLVAAGTFDQLCEENQMFRILASVAK